MIPAEPAVPDPPRIQSIRDSRPGARWLAGLFEANGVGAKSIILCRSICRPAIAHLGYKTGDFPVSEKLAGILALPIYSELAADDIEYVCEPDPLLLRVR